MSDVHAFDTEKLVTDHVRWSAFKETKTKRFDESLGYVRLILGKAASSGPDIVILPGDLTKDGERASHEALARVLSSFETSGKSAYVVPGNHDIDNSQAVGFFDTGISRVSSVSAVEFESIYSDFGYGEAFSRMENGLSYAVEPVPGLIILALDTARWREHGLFGPIVSGRIDESTLLWAGSVLDKAKAGGKAVIVFQHHPLPHPGDPGSFDSREASAARELFERMGVKVVIAGHTHDYWSDSGMDGTFASVTANAISSSPYSALIMHLSGSMIGLEPFPRDQ